ncbi:hypothetical protein DFS34DRAFT_516967 [Phlyctochytrium arcticum]|nr:hypothetical protein DFS34DRAFT_516967 [Phlyctochytrium arcticum]
MGSPFNPCSTCGSLRRKNTCCKIEKILWQLNRTDRQKARDTLLKRVFKKERRVRGVKMSLLPKLRRARELREQRLARAAEPAVWLDSSAPFSKRSDNRRRTPGSNVVRRKAVHFDSLLPNRPAKMYYQTNTAGSRLGDMGHLVPAGSDVENWRFGAHHPPLMPSWPAARPRSSKLYIKNVISHKASRSVVPIAISGHAPIPNKQVPGTTFQVGFITATPVGHSVFELKSDQPTPASIEGNESGFPPLPSPKEVDCFHVLRPTSISPNQESHPLSACRAQRRFSVDVEYRPPPQPVCPLSVLQGSQLL